MFNLRSYRPALAATLFALSLASTPAYAASPDWSVALPPAALGTFIDGSGLRVLVAAGGTGADPAASALTVSLRALSSVKLTMPDDALGNLAEADDATIVAKAKVLPVDLVAVVRVFPGNDGAENLVATIYRVDGTVLSAFTAGTDAPLVSQKTTGSGMAGATSSAVDDVVGGNASDRDARVKEFEERAIWMQGYAAVDSRSGRIVSTWSVPIQGRYGEALIGPSFYEYIGEPDFARTFKKRKATRTAIMLAGGAVAGGGLGYMLLSSQVPSQCSTDRCYEEIDRANAQASAIGISIVTAGTVTLLIPFFIDPHPVKANERSRLVDEYNDKLREELGLGKARPTSLGATFSAGGWVGANGGGAQVAGTF